MGNLQDDNHTKEGDNVQGANAHFTPALSGTIPVEWKKSFRP